MERKMPQRNYVAEKSKGKSMRAFARSRMRSEYGARTFLLEVSRDVKSELTAHKGLFRMVNPLISAFSPPCRPRSQCTEREQSTSINGRTIVAKKCPYTATQSQTHSLHTEQYNPPSTTTTTTTHTNSKQGF